MKQSLIGVVVFVLFMITFMAQVHWYIGDMILALPRSRHTLEPSDYGRLCDTPDGPPCNKSWNQSIYCGQPGFPCRYFDRYDLRIIVLAHSRAASLGKSLDAINTLEMDGDSAIVEIWIDALGPHKHNENVLKVAENWKCKIGAKRVNKWRDNVGIIGNWIDTWRPASHCKDWVSCRELALILEDDIDLSPMAYRWLKAAARFYNNRTDVAGLTLTDTPPKIVSGKMAGRDLRAPKNNAAFLYMMMGSWGFAPHPWQWRQFQHWFHDVTLDSWKAKKGFKPTKSGYIPKLPQTILGNWYEGFRKAGKENSMWTIWLVHYQFLTETFCLYYNLPSISKQTNISLAHNRYEKGLHYNGAKLGGSLNKYSLMTSWNESFVNFSLNTPTYDFSGQQCCQQKQNYWIL